MPYILQISLHSQLIYHNTRIICYTWTIEVWPFYGPETAWANTQSSNGRVKNALFSCKNGTCVEGYDWANKWTHVLFGELLNFCSNYAIEAGRSTSHPSSTPMLPLPPPPMPATYLTCCLYLFIYFSDLTNCLWLLLYTCHWCMWITCCMVKDTVYCPRVMVSLLQRPPNDLSCDHQIYIACYIYLSYYNS